MPTITGRITSSTSPIIEVQRLPIPMTDAQKREASRMRTALQPKSSALSKVDFRAVERHILDTTADAYRL
jgi:hypothetical protein